METRNVSRKERIANLVARSVIARPWLETIVAAACRTPAILGLKVGALAIAYPRVLDRVEIRLAELDGYRLFVNIAEYQGVEVYFFGHSGVLWFTDQLLEAGGTFLDIGANVGTYAFYVASRLGETGRVYAFEPNPSHSELIERSIRENTNQGRVCLERRAAWVSSDALLTFYLSNNPSNSGTSSLINHGVYVSTSKTIEVSTVKVDDFAHDHAIEACSLVKIDVERAEDEVLRGMSRMLSERRVAYLIVEMVSGSEAQRVLENHGYAAYLVDPTRRQFRRKHEHGVFGDFLVVAPQKMAEFEQMFRDAITDGAV